MLHHQMGCSYSVALHETVFMLPEVAFVLYVGNLIDERGMFH